MIDIIDVISSFFARFLRRKPVAAPKLPPAQLPPEILAQVMREAAVLRGEHAVGVAPLAPGETPGLPKRADS